MYCGYAGAWFGEGGCGWEKCGGGDRDDETHGLIANLLLLPAAILNACLKGFHALVSIEGTEPERFTSENNTCSLMDEEMKCSYWHWSCIIYTFQLLVFNMWVIWVKCNFSTICELLRNYILLSTVNVKFVKCCPVLHHCEIIFSSLQGSWIVFVYIWK